MVDEGFETREVQARVKESLTVFDPQVVENPEPMAGTPRTVTYECSHDLVQSDRQVIPARCPHCGGPMYG